MSKQVKKTLVPKLRFPEFRDAGEWKKKSLGEVFIEKPRPIKTKDKHNYSLVTVKRRYGGVVSRGAFKGESIKVKSQFLLEKDDFLISKRQIVHSACGLVPENLEGSIVSNEYSVLVAREDYDVSFLNYFSQQPKVSQSFLECSIGIVIEKMLFKLNDWLKKEFLFPPLIEQQKITNCLSSIDELITAHCQKYDTLKTHKKGLLQQLFPADGETVPKLRFPEFQDARKWIEIPLKKVFSIFQGFAFSSKDSVKDGVRWLKIADVSIQHMNHNTPSYLPSTHKDKHAKFSVKQGDYVIALTRPILSKQLKMAPVDKVFHGALLNQRVGKLITTQNIAFVYFLLQTSKVISDIEKSISGSEPPNLSVQQIEDIKTSIPSSSKEQQKIADCLSSLDDLITAQAQKIESLKTHKKGLMQQLFPAADGEVNG